MIEHEMKCHISKKFLVRDDARHDGKLRDTVSVFTEQVVSTA